MRVEGFRGEAGEEGYWWVGWVGSGRGVQAHVCPGVLMAEVVQDFEGEGCGGLGVGMGMVVS